MDCFIPAACSFWMKFFAPTRREHALDRALYFVMKAVPVTSKDSLSKSKPSLR